MLSCFISESSVAMARTWGLMMLMLAGKSRSLEKRAECEMWSHLENKTMPLQVSDETLLLATDTVCPE